MQDYPVCSRKQPLQETTASCGKKRPECIDCLALNESGTIAGLPYNPLLSCLGFRVGKHLQLVARQKFGGPLIVRINGRCVALSRSLAQQVKLASPQGDAAVGGNA